MKQKMTWKIVTVFVFYLLVFLTVWFPIMIHAQEDDPQPSSEHNRRRKSGSNRDRKRNASPRDTAVFHTDVPELPFDIILGRPTQNGVTLSILAYRDREGFIVYGTQSGNYTHKTDAYEFPRGDPLEIALDGLGPDTRYYYQFHSREADSDDFSSGEEYSFHTQRASGRPFTFTLQADSHLDQNAIPEMYVQTLMNALAGDPDFHIDLGDTFMTDKYRENYRDSFAQYLAQRYYFGLIGPSTPLFLVLGNHDGEMGTRLNRTAENMTVWASRIRKRYYPNPFPDGFYAGNEIEEPFIGLAEDYYAWEWGDALFVVLDPYRFTALRGNRRNDPWSRTLGEAQYRWLEKTLAASEAKFKFVFIHNLLGGKDRASRGGVEIARNFEWGGHNTDGIYEFSEKRPGGTGSAMYHS